MVVVREPMSLYHVRHGVEIPGMRKGTVPSVIFGGLGYVCCCCWVGGKCCELEMGSYRGTPLLCLRHMFFGHEGDW